MSYFQEEQRFKQWWLWALMMGVNALILGLFTHAFYTQFYLGEPWGTKPTSDSTLIIVFLLAIITLVVCNVMIILAKLEIKIDRNYIHYRYFPYIRSWNRISKDQLKKVYIRKYAAINEYGGWGYRVFMRKDNGALNVQGNMGLQIIFKDDTKLLLGTQKPEALKKATQKFMVGHKEEEYG
ncbi:hypothetical protein FNH22_01920 [Fulvivirga sp. M361]|uniref:hypothetical protein n=1 Tax=Fulvivirga sp. M361 TaxID=2594266 RepID=UPI00117AEBCA|nr:hypothetical protein [Fulvivirga sp. M361]TRX62102.1 hypothetical protein FNH22_01920 [Fulvivirga sp. M361]